MPMRRCLVSVAQYEFNALMQDTQIAIDSLQRQRESVKQSMEATQRANEHPDCLPDETDGLVIELQDKLHRLNAALAQVMREIEDMEAAPLSPSPEPFIVLPLPLAQVPNDDPSLSERNPK